MRAARGGMLALVVALVAGACGGSTQDGAEPIAAEAFIPQLVDAACGVKDCCEAAGESFDAESCRAAWTEEFNRALGPSDNTDYDAAAAGRCVSAMRTFFQGCEQGSLLGFQGCRDVVKGKLPDGATCQYSSECAAPPGGLASCLDHVCDAGRRAQEGDSCRLTCSELPGGGTACSAGALGGLSGGSDACFLDDGLHCGPDQRCVPLADAGQPCAVGGCKAGYYCADTCRPLVPEGESCALSSAACASGLYCDQSEVCRRRVGLGEPCLEFAACRDGASCQNGVCRPLAWRCVDPQDAAGND